MSDKLIKYPKTTKVVNEEELSSMVSVDKFTFENYTVYNYKPEEVNDENKHIRGIIFKDGKLVSRGLEYASEIVYNDEFKQLSELLNELPTESKSNVYTEKQIDKLYVCYEGATVRAWFDDDNKFHLSTNKKLDAFSSRWSSDNTFGEHFMSRIIELCYTNKSFHNLVNHYIPQYNSIYVSFIEFLRKDSKDNGYQYTFLIPNGEDNRIVCKNNKTPQLLHIATYDKNWNMIIDHDIGIPKPLEIKCRGIELHNYLSTLDYNESPGIISVDNKGTQCKIITKSYKTLSDLRGNVPSIRFRYLQLRNSSDKSEFIKLYQEKETIFKEVEDKLISIIAFTHAVYINRYVHHQFIIVNKDIHNILLKCHNWHKLNKASNIVTMDIMRQFIDKEDPTVLNRLIKLSTYW